MQCNFTTVLPIYYDNNNHVYDILEYYKLLNNNIIHLELIEFIKSNKVYNNNNFVMCNYNNNKLCGEYVEYNVDDVKIKYNFDNNKFEHYYKACLEVIYDEYSDILTNNIINIYETREYNNNKLSKIIYWKIDNNNNNVLLKSIKFKNNVKTCRYNETCFNDIKHYRDIEFCKIQ